MTKGSLSFGVTIGGVKVGLKAESTLTEVSAGRKMLVKLPSRRSLLTFPRLTRSRRKPASRPVNVDFLPTILL